MQRNPGAAESLRIRSNGASKNLGLVNPLPVVACESRGQCPQQFVQQLSTERAVDDDAVEIDQAGAAIDRKRDRVRRVREPAPGMGAPRSLQRPLVAGVETSLLDARGGL